MYLSLAMFMFMRFNVEMVECLLDSRLLRVDVDADVRIVRLASERLDDCVRSGRRAHAPVEAQRLVVRADVARVDVNLLVEIELAEVRFQAAPRRVGDAEALHRAVDR